MTFTYNIFSKHENPLCVMAQRSAGFLYLTTVKVGIIAQSNLKIQFFQKNRYRLAARTDSGFLARSGTIQYNACIQEGKADIDTVNKPINVFLDTDIGPDCDDAGSLTLVRNQKRWRH